MINAAKREYKINVGIINVGVGTPYDPRSRARIQNKRGNHKVFCVGVFGAQRPMINKRTARVHKKLWKHQVFCYGVYRAQRPMINEGKREYTINVRIIRHFARVSVGTTEQ